MKAEVSLWAVPRPPHSPSLHTPIWNRWCQRGKSGAGRLSPPALGGCGLASLPADTQLFPRSLGQRLSLATAVGRRPRKILPSHRAAITAPLQEGEEREGCLFVCLFVSKTPPAPARMGRKGRHASWRLWSEAPLFPGIPSGPLAQARVDPSADRHQGTVGCLGCRRQRWTSDPGWPDSGRFTNHVGQLLAPLRVSVSHYKKRDCTRGSARVLPGPNMFRSRRTDKATAGISGSGSGPA